MIVYWLQRIRVLGFVFLLMGTLSACVMDDEELSSVNEEIPDVGSSEFLNEEIPDVGNSEFLNEEIPDVGSSESFITDEWALIGDSLPWWNGLLWPLQPVGDHSVPSFIPTSIRAFSIPGVRINESFLPEFGPLLTYLGLTSETVVSQFNRATLFGFGYKKLIVFGGGNDILLGPCRNDCYYAHNPNDMSGEYCGDAAALPSLQCQGVIDNVAHDLQTLIFDQASKRGVTNIIYVLYPQVPDWSDGDCSSCEELCLGWPIEKCLRKNECGNFGARTTAALHYVRNKILGVNARGLHYQVVELKPRFLDASGNPDKTLFDRCDGFSGIHPSVKGSKRIADAIWEAMQNPNGNDACDDGVQNGDEEGVDCGGSCPERCGAVPSCYDGIQNGDEVDVDCGGSCPDHCVACAGDGDCSGSQFCNRITDQCEEKVPNGWVCLRDGVCQSSHCRTGFCVQCKEDSHCGAGEFCNLVTAKCEEHKNPDGSLCLHDGACQSNHCRAGFCVECTGDNHCDAGEHCNLVTAKCEPDVPNGSLCVHDGVCQSGHCRAGFCVECSGDEHCGASEYCNLVTAKCEEHKNPDGSLCLHDGACQSNHCRLGFCVECSGDEHCGAGEHCNLLLAKCEPDVPNGSLCVHDGVCQSGHCRLGFCVECTEDSQCSDDKYCSVLPASCVGRKSNDSLCTRGRECQSNNCTLTFLGPRCR